MRRVFLGALLLLTSFAAVGAVQGVATRVSNVEATYMPDEIYFKATEAIGQCPAGSMLRWRKSADNNKAVYALLLGALLNGKRVAIFMEPTDATCTVQFIHLWAD